MALPSSLISDISLVVWNQWWNSANAADQGLFPWRAVVKHWPEHCICSLHWGVMFRSPTSLTDFLPARSITGRGHLSISPFSYSYLFFPTIFLSYNSPSVQFTHCKYAHQCCCCCCCFVSHTSRTFPSPQREASFLLTVIPPASHPSPLAPHNHLSTFFLCRYFIWIEPYKTQVFVTGFLDVCKVHPCCSMHRFLIPFCGWIESHCRTENVLSIHPSGFRTPGFMDPPATINIAVPVSEGTQVFI